METIPIGPGTASHVLADELVSGSIKNSTITGDAYGIFVSGSNQTQIINNKIISSLVHGVFMHRFAKNATIEATKVIGSGGDGFVLSRATEKVKVVDCLAERNKRNGFTLNGRALAGGPSASGESLAVYGDSSVSNSIARDNGRYGVEVLGGSRLAVQTSEVIGGDMGIVVREGASGVQISGNKLTNQRRQGDRAARRGDRRARGRQHDHGDRHRDLSARLRRHDRRKQDHNPVEPQGPRDHRGRRSPRAPRSPATPSSARGRARSASHGPPTR